MGQLFQVECWEKHHHFGSSCGLLWLIKFAKATTKVLEIQNDIFGILFMKIMEIRRKGR